MDVGSSVVAFPRLLLKYFFNDNNNYLSQKMAKDRLTNLPIVSKPQNTPHCGKQFLYYKNSEKRTI